MHILLKIFLPLFLCIISYFSYGQKVGLVLSGGGVKGLAHIGVIKALEENNIPIDYITGTSMGAIIGGLYAIGYTPAEMEKFMGSEEFLSLAYGKVDEKYIYYFKKNDDDPSWLSFDFNVDSVFRPHLPTNIIPTHKLDLAMMEIFSPPIAAAEYDFDSLFIPYRCVASDIYNKQPVIFSKGDLGPAIRASMTIPFFFKPLTINGRLFFDGFIYNNFPADIMKNDFHPDAYIGSNVSSNSAPPESEDLSLQIENLMINKSDYSLPQDSGIMIEPAVDKIASTDFQNKDGIIEIGYKAAMARMDEIKKLISARSDQAMLDKKRKQFKSKIPLLLMKDIYVTGTKKWQTDYIINNLTRKKQILTQQQFETEYFKMLADDRIDYIFPRAKYNPETNYFNLYLHVIKKKKFQARVGGNISSSSINQAFAGLEYKYFGRKAYSNSVNIYFGRLYSSVQLKARVDFSSRLPFYVTSSMTLNRWDFFKSNTDLFFEDVRPSYMIQNEANLSGSIGCPISISSKLEGGGAIARMNDEYYETKNFLKADVADHTYFDLTTVYAKVEKKTLNQKQYADKGSYLGFAIREIIGIESHRPGSTSQFTDSYDKEHNWLRFNFNYDHYFKIAPRFTIGASLEAVHSLQPFFRTYTSSILAQPSFCPIPQSKTMFLENYRANSFLAPGIKSIIHLMDKMDFRLEGYLFQPYKEIKKTSEGLPEYGKAFFNQHFIVSSVLVYNTPFGPASLSFNYFDKEENKYYLVFNFGYILFNKRGIDY